MTIGERIRKKRQEMGYTQEELAIKLGYASRSSVNKVETSRVLSNKKVALFAKALNTTPAYLMGWTDDNIDDIYSYDNITPINTKRFKMLGNIACGTPIYADEEKECYIDAGTAIKADFCLTCKGDSMINARINNGDIVFIKSQSIVENGEIAAVIIEDEATLKRVFYYPDNNLLILRAENPNYKDMTYTNEQLDTIRILGKAVAFQSNVI